MAQYGGGGGPPRYGHGQPRPRFNNPPNRHVPRNNYNDNRPPLNRDRPSTGQTNVPAATNKQNNEQSNSTISTANDSSESNRAGSTDKRTSDVAMYASSHETNETKPSEHVQESVASAVPKRSRSTTDLITESINSSSISQASATEKRTTQGGRCRLFIGNIPTDLTQDDFRSLFSKYGELAECFANPSRGFGFVKLSCRQLAEQAKQELDGYVLRGKSLRIRFASQGATLKVKNLSPNVSNELLKEAFERNFGPIERAVVVVDDRGKSTGEGIIEFEKKPSAQKCLNECTERCFFLTSELRPVIVEPWEIRDDEDGLPEKSLVKNVAYAKEREVKPRFAELNSIEQTIGLKWKELEQQEKQLLDEVKRRMQYATEQLQIEIDRMYLDHKSQMIREELEQRQEELRRIDELRNQEMDRRRQMMPMHHAESYNNPYHPNLMGPSNMSSYNDYGPGPYGNMNPAQVEAAYTTNQVARGYGVGNVGRPNNDDYRSHSAGFDRKRARY